MALVVTAVLLLAACGAESQPGTEEPAQASSPSEKSAETSSLLKVICYDDGSTELLDDTVKASADGVHIQVDNRAGEFVSLNGTAIDFGEGITEDVAQVAPGEAKVACWPGSMHRGPEPKRLPVTVIDTAGHWRPGELGCGEDSLIAGQTNDYADGSPGIEGEPVDIVRENTPGLEEGDEVVPIGYPEANYGRAVGVKRDGAFVAIIGFTPTDKGRWLIGGGSTCADSGIRF